MQEPAAHSLKMGASCSTTAGAAAGACQKACDGPNTVQILNCVRDEEVDQEVLMNCKLLRACAEGSLDSTREALEKGAELETRTSKYVMLPVKSWGEEAEQQPNGVLPISSDSQESLAAVRFGLTPLMVASKEGHSSIVQLLLRVRAAPNTQDEDGMRPLHFAAEAGCVDCCKVLLAAGAAALAEDDSGRDAYACLPHECVMLQRERGSWAALLRPSGAAAAGCGEAAAGKPAEKAAAAPAAARPQQGGRRPARREAEWDPFLGAMRGQDGM